MPPTQMSVASPKAKRVALANCWPGRGSTSGSANPRQVRQTNTVVRSPPALMITRLADFRPISTPSPAAGCQWGDAGRAIEWLHAKVFPMSAPAPRIRVLVAASSADAPEWRAWQAARERSDFGMRMALQRISAAAGSDRAEAVGLGYGETLRWFAPVVTEAQRQLILQYAQEVLAAGEFPPLGPQLQRMIRSFESQPAAPAITSGIVLLSHADTDLL